MPSPALFTSEHLGSQANVLKLFWVAVIQWNVEVAGLNVGKQFASY
jgi:hypothetical protein